MPSVSPSPQQPELPLPTPPQKIEAVKVTNVHSSQSLQISPNPSLAQQYRRKRRRKRVLKKLLIWLLYLGKLISLCGGVVISAFAGILIAHLFPDPNPKMPYFEIFLRQSEAVIKIIQTIPPKIVSIGRNLGGDIHSDQSIPPRKIVSAPDLPDPPPPPKSSVGEQQKKLGGELTKVQSELNRLIQQMKVLETRLKSEDMDAAEVSIINPSPNSTDNLDQTQTYSFSPNQPLLIILPSDALFTDSQVVLSPSASFVLDNVLPNLLPYENQVIVIAGHTDDVGTPGKSQTISLQQAELIRGYLNRVLKGQYRIVVVGYGSNQPLAPNTNSSNRQRNRRIEISAQES